LDIAWDGKSLWALHGDGTLQRFEPRADTFQLKKVDSYAPRLARVGLEEPTGLTWDGSDLWVISTGSVFKLSDTAQPVCTIEVGPWPFVHEFGGLAWDGRFLWTTDAHLGVLYRVDPNQCAK
jgi:hypothetical protein